MVLGKGDLSRSEMIGVTISGKAYAAIAATLPAQSAEREMVPDLEYRIWLPRAVVIRLRTLGEPEETFSERHSSAGGTRRLRGHHAIARVGAPRFSTYLSRCQSAPCRAARTSDAVHPLP